MILGGNPKALNLTCIENINNHAKNYKRNYKTCQKLFEKPVEEASIQFKNETTPLLIENREPSNPLREEVLNWFFSLPLETRFKVITVENSWVINIIHQMYVYYKQDNSTSFEFSQAEKTIEKDSEFLNTQIYFQNSAMSGTNPDGLAATEESQNLQSHFSIRQIKRDKHDYYLTSMFLKETRFFSVHANIDCLSLSPKVLDDKDLFLHYFKNFSKEKCFSKLIEVIQDPKSKLYSFSFPKWIEKDFHQITAFIIAFLEHAILIKFILNYNNNKNKDKLITSLHDELSFTEFFKLRREIIFFLNENYPNNNKKNSNSNNNGNNNNNSKDNSLMSGFGNYSNAMRLGFQSCEGSTGFNYSFNSNTNNETVVKFIKNLNVKKIYQNVYSNKKLIEAINLRNAPSDKNYSELFNRKLNSQEPFFEGVNEEDTEKKILRLYTNEEIIIFVDNLIFTRIDSVWRLDFYLGIELFEAIHNLYTDKNALDLIKEFDEGKESSGNGKGKKAKNKKVKVPELTTRDVEKMNFNYYKPYMNKDNLINQNRQQSSLSNENSNVSFANNNIKNSSVANSNSRDYGTINNSINCNNNELSSNLKEKDAGGFGFASIGSSKRENLIYAKNHQNFIKEKERENPSLQGENKNQNRENKQNININNTNDLKNINNSNNPIELQQHQQDLETTENPELNKDKAVFSDEKNFILCNEIVIQIIDNALLQTEKNAILKKHKIKTLDDVLDNIHTIEKKSKEISKLLTYSNINNSDNQNFKESNDDNNNNDNNNSTLKNLDLKIKQNSLLAIECAYDIELGMKVNSRNNTKTSEDAISTSNSKNNFIIENHQISIENTSFSVNNNNNNTNKEEKNLSFNNTNNTNDNSSYGNSNLNGTEHCEFYSEKDLEDQAEEYFNDKEASDKESDSNYNEKEGNSAQNNFASSNNYNNNNNKKGKKNNSSNNFNDNSDSEFEFNNNNNNSKNAKNNRKRDASPPSEPNGNQDEDSENNLNAKDKRKKNKKKVQKFYQINIEKMNKKKNNEKNKNENKGNQSYTINKSTQTQTSKEINSVNLNLNINNQNVMSTGINGINNTNNHNPSSKKFDKKFGNSKNNNNNNNSNYMQMTNLNINNNVNIHNLKSNSNNMGMSKGSLASKEYSKYDYPKNSKKNSFHKNSFNNASYANNANGNLNNNSDSPSVEKNYSNKIANLSSIVNSKNIKEFNYNYSYSFNNNKNSGGAANMNNWNINFNYDLNYDNIYNANSNNNSLNNNFNTNGNSSYSTNANSRKKSNNWSEAKMLSASNASYYENSRSFVSSGAALNSSGANGFSLMKPNNNNEFLAYVFKLHYDIVNYHNNVVEIVNALKDIKVNVISYIEKLLKEFIDYELSLDVFGSFASDLSIESSDIDLKVNIMNQDSINIDYEELIFNLVKKFNALNIFEFVMPIHTASVPIIKLIIDPTRIIEDDNLLKYEEFKHSEAYNNFKFNKEELNKFRIDLTFLDLIKKQQTNSLGSIDFAKNHVILYAEIKPILYVLKRLLQERNLNSAFNGGLSSYCIFLLILAFLKYQKTTNFNLNSSQNSISNCNNLGKLLIDLMEYYGRMFNFHVFTIDVNQSNPYIYDTQYYEKCPVIVDPLNYHNVSKSSFRIDEVKECFSKAYEYLIQIKYKYDRKDSDNNRNIIYDLILNKNN